MDFETIKLWKDGTDETLLFRVLDDDEEIKPAMLVIPGGGYACVCHDWEGTPIAARFSELGFRTFILRYRVAPHRFPEPQQDALRAMKLIRGNAEAWKIFPDNIAAVGFSAGGHLCGSLGTIARGIAANDGDAFDGVDPLPNALIMAYAVVTGGEKAHRGSVNCLMGDSSAEHVEQFSLERHVDGGTPPTYIWATQDDGLVPVENSVLYSLAMHEAGRLCELHLFSHGQHGIQLGAGREDVPAWPGEAARFLRESCGFRL